MNHRELVLNTATDEAVEDFLLRKNYLRGLLGVVSVNWFALKWSKKKTDGIFAVLNVVVIYQWLLAAFFIIAKRVCKRF